MSSDSGTKGNQPEQSDRDPSSGSMRDALDSLATSESGLGFIYAALALLTSRFHLRDVVIVLEDENAGTQVFRLGGKAVSTEFAVRLGNVPGLYCEPGTVDAHDLDYVRSACQRELSAHQARFVEVQEPLANADDRQGPATTSQNAVERSALVSKDRDVTTRDSLRSFVDRSRVRSTRGVISALLVIVDVVTLALTVADIHGPIRFVFGLILGVLIPGWSVVGLLNLRNGALEVGLTMATSLALVMIAAQVLITVGLWHPIVLEEFTCVVCLPSLLWQSGTRLRPLGHAK